MEKSFPPNGRACLSRASHQRCGPAASRDSPAAMRPGSSRRKPAGRSLEVLSRMGLPAPVPRGRGPRSPVYTSVRTLTNRARPARRTSLRRDPGPGARHTAACTFGLRTFRTSCRRGPSPMDVSSTATAYTAFSEVLVGFAWGTESHSGQRNTSALVARGLPGSGGRYCRPLATWWPPSHAARPPGAVGLPVGRGMTTARRSPASHALHCLRLPGRRNIRRSACGPALYVMARAWRRSG
jgi:hypothetical protein